MCENFVPCCVVEEFTSKRPLTFLLLDCWQREYDKRPYRNFRLNPKTFEQRMFRKFDAVKDFRVVKDFLLARSICSVQLYGLDIMPFDESDMVEFVKRSLKKMRVIELKMMTLPILFFKSLSSVSCHMNVKELNLEGTHLNSKDVRFLQCFLIKSQSLRYLNVNNCSINQTQFVYLADGIHKCDTMRAFHCNRLLGGYTLTLDTVKLSHLVSSLIWQYKLQELEMQFCEFCGHDMEVITEYIANANNKLINLNLANNKISQHGTEFLLRAIVKNENLRYLNISRNKLGTPGGLVVAKYLSSCWRLEKLDITYNDIGTEAMNMILLANKKPVKFTELKLFGNCFDAKCAITLRRLLDARVIPLSVIDISSTYDESLSEYRIIPFI